MRKHLSTIILILVFLTGLSLLLYPTVSDYWNSTHQTRVIANYEEAVTGMDVDTTSQYWDAANAYNESLLNRVNRFAPFSTEEWSEYNNLLNISGTGVMSHLEIPSLDCSLPIYHSVDDSVLQNGIGHLEGSSLPVGGENTHCVLSGHRGLPSARLLTDLNKMVEGDIFMLHTLYETLTYEVDQIRIVLPNEVEFLVIEDGQDLCTLVTCTPYGINTHRLLVRGHRIENRNGDAFAYVSSDAIQVEPLLIAPIVAAPILSVLFFLFLRKSGGRKKRGEVNEE